MDSRSTAPPPAATTTTTTTTTTISVASTTDPPATGNVTPGAYCATVGALGTYNGNTYVCSTTSKEGVPYEPPGTARWRRL